MKKTTKKKTVHKKRPVANRHRKVHKAHGSLLLILWAFVIITSSLLVAGYIKHHTPLLISENGISLKVDKVKYDDVGVQPFVAPKGWKFVIIHTVVKNHTSSTFNFAPVVQTYVVDSKGHKYGMSPTILDDPFAAGPISPNNTRSGQLSYLIPIGAKNVTLKFQP